MKSSTIIMPAFAAIALAQYNSTNTTTNATASTSYTTITAYTDLCTADGVTSTSTATITSEVCEICSGGKPPATFSGVLTTYTTVYKNVCPTGSTLTPATYTVTEPCPSGVSQGAPMPSSWVPAGFATTVAPCECEGGSATFTVPAPTAPAATAPPATGSPATPAGTTATVGVELANNGTTPAAGNGTGPVPTAPIQPGAASRSTLSVCSALIAAMMAMVYVL